MLASRDRATQTLEVAQAERDGPATGDPVRRVGDPDELLAVGTLEQLDQRRESFLADTQRNLELLDPGRRTPGGSDLRHGGDATRKGVTGGIRLCHETVKIGPQPVSTRPAANKPEVMSGLSLRRLAGVAAAAFATLVVGAFAAAAAHAAPNVQYGLTDDAWIEDGPGTLAERLDQLQAVGVTLVRLSLDWNTIAREPPTDATDPTDPAYDWTSVDPVLTALHDRGISVLLQLVGTPSWANGGKASNVAPTSASTFAAFAQAAATKYPWVQRWLIWNEPNQRRWLLPTSPRVYTTRLLNPAYDAIHEAIPGAQVGGGVTAPRAASHGVSPVAWIAGMYAAHAKLDAYAQNPYPLDPKHETPLTGGCGHCATITMATLSKLVRLVSLDFGKARIWLTEYGYQSNPPDPILGVAPALQARYLSEGDYQAWHTPRVDLLIHFLYRDEPDVGRFQSGLITLAGVEKPAYAAYQLPLAQIARSGGRVSLWGQLRAPAAGDGPARLQRRAGSAWRTVATLRPSPRARFVKWSGALPAGTLVRLKAGTLTGAPLVLH